MNGSWLYVPDLKEWRLYDQGCLQIRVSAARVDEIARSHGRTRRDVLDWIGSRPKAPLTAIRRAS